MLGLVRDFRLLATALHGEIPDWVGSLERLLAPTVGEAAPPASSPLPAPVAPSPAEPPPLVVVDSRPSLVLPPDLPAPAESARPPQGRWSRPLPPVKAPVLTAPLPHGEDDETVNLGELQSDAGATTFLSNEPASVEQSAPPPPPADHAINLGAAYFRKGESYRRQRDFKRAAACYSEAIRLAPGCYPRAAGTRPDLPPGSKTRPRHP